MSWRGGRTRFVDSNGGSPPTRRRKASSAETADTRGPPFFVVRAPLDAAAGPWGHLLARTAMKSVEQMADCLFSRTQSDATTGRGDDGFSNERRRERVAQVLAMRVVCAKLARSALLSHLPCLNPLRNPSPSSKISPERREDASEKYILKKKSCSRDAAARALQGQSQTLGDIGRRSVGRMRNLTGTGS